MKYPTAWRMGNSAEFVNFLGRKMTSIYPNDTAFPLKNEPNSDDYLGLSKREYFAVMAMQALLATNAFNGAPKSIAKYAIEYADHLIDALNNQ